MAHIHRVYDTDGHFIINANTRLLENASEARVNLVQGDHNSERVTFELERYVDGHDMSTCNRVEVIFTNKGTGGTSKGRYFVGDLQVAPGDEDVVIFSWLISQVATLYDGALSFGIRFSCIGDDNVLDYAWNTATYTGLTVSKGAGNVDADEKPVYDSLQDWIDTANQSVAHAAVWAASAAQDANSAAASAQAAQDALNSILAKPSAICVDVSGALVAVKDAAACPVQSLVSEIKPTADGVSAVTLIRTGRNLISHLDYTITQGNSGTIITEDVIDVVNPSGYDYGKIPVALKGGTTYTLVIDWEVYGRAEDATDYTTGSYRIDKLQSSATHVNAKGNISKRIVRAYTATEDVEANILWYPNFGSKVKGCSRSRVMLLEGEYTEQTAPAFEPGVKQIMTTALPEAVHGGTLDWTNGLLTITHGADGAEMAEPVTRQFDPQTVEMLRGSNTLWSDMGDTSIVYAADTKLYIDNAVAALAASILNA